MLLIKMFFSIFYKDLFISCMDQSSLHYSINCIYHSRSLTKIIGGKSHEAI